MSHEDLFIESGSGDVFVDLGFSTAEAEELHAKAVCIRRIALIKQRHGWTQTQLGEAIGMAQSEVSQLLRGKLSRFSMDRLLSALHVLGVGVRITLVDEAEPRLVVLDRVAESGTP